jgi:prevent-host-death family protein
MTYPKTHITKKSLRKASGATDRDEQNLALARKEEEAIAQMVKDFRRQERKKTRPTIRVLSLSTIRANFEEVLDRVDLNNERVIVTYRGKPQAVIISITDFNKITNLDISQ